MNYKTKIKIMKNVFNIVALCTLLFLSSCGTVKRLTYLQDLEYDTPYPVSESSSVKIQADDKIAIRVTSSNQELAAPFNGGVLSVNVETGATSVTGGNGAQEYLVTKEGVINFPILGILNVRGMSLDEMCSMIEAKIREKDLINDPSVKADFTNFQYTVLGEVGQGVYTVQNNKINIIDAIAKAGRIPVLAKNDDIMVIRTEDGIRTAYQVNLRTKDIYESPVYYLRQNDVIYIKPSRYKSDGTVEATRRYISYGFSLLNVMTTLLVYLNLR